jgi:hypothetical protein
MTLIVQSPIKEVIITYLISPTKAFCEAKSLGGGYLSPRYFHASTFQDLFTIVSMFMFYMVVPIKYQSAYPLVHY